LIICPSKKMKNHIRSLLLVVMLWGSLLTAKGQSWYWIGFTDKNNTPYSLSDPGEYLSERAIARRTAQGIAIDSTDLPVNRAYIDSIAATGAEVLHASRWMNGITVKTGDTKQVAQWKGFPFVRSVERTRSVDTTGKSAFSKFGTPAVRNDIDTSLYGASVYQVGLMNGQHLHNQGYTGEGMVIALLDAGYLQANGVSTLKHLFDGGKILGTKDFVNPASNIYNENVHGTMVLSVIGARLPGQMMGTAPDASFWLIRTEDVATESRVEEDYWIAGAEFADSVGADIINSSLGYTTFDDTLTNHTWADLDGKTTRITRAANLAAGKGMLVFNSAGNDGRNGWRYISAPADGTGVIAVAATDRFGTYAAFSSVGFPGRTPVKPDLAAMGSGTAVQNYNGDIVNRNGTSFSSPLLAGMTASFWQAHRDVPATEIRRILTLSASQALSPDTLLGYGIPDFSRADLLLNQFSHAGNISQAQTILFPNPFTDEITLVSPGDSHQSVRVEIIHASGAVAFSKQVDFTLTARIGELQGLQPGIYIVRITGNGRTETHKILKTR
jgi:hypothetical protein